TPTGLADEHTRQRGCRTPKTTITALTGLADEHTRQHGCRTPKTTITYADRPGGRAHAAAWLPHAKDGNHSY
ncbi:hypothetical protein, partial [Chloroflexus sp.]|uniref:hypothetical protein n=1 Tax=Chloroflexus sp. TaxID=1904827 RepID=UPI002ADE073C